VTPGDAAPARRAANWRRRIKPVELQPRLGHRIEVRRADGFVSCHMYPSFTVRLWPLIESNITPSQIVSHDENEIWLVGSPKANSEQKQYCE
jgi:hypothetical protein